MVDLSAFNLRFKFDDRLREALENPDDVRTACDRLEEQFAALTKPDTRAQTLAMLGSLQRMLGELTEAEISLREALRLIEELHAPLSRLIAARIRLANVLQWQAKFAEADAMFITCVADAKSLSDAREMESFAIQHYGKSLFDQRRLDEAAQCFYDAMMIRIGLRREDLADSSRLALDRTLNDMIPRLGEEVVQAVLEQPRLPSFVREVLGRIHAGGDLPTERANCINAVLNFYGEPPYRYTTAEPLEGLAFLKERCEQLAAGTPLRYGDVIACWSRSGGAWDQRKIAVAEMNPADPAFPYGLVFEHMAVIVGDEIVFHKPSPALQVPYKIEHLKAAYAALKHAPGFEMTLHRPEH